MEKVKFLIIGGGVTGLGFANFIRTGDYRIIEKESIAGGFCRTIYKKDFIWDYAGHFFHFQNEDLKAFFNSKIHSEDLIYKVKNTKILYKKEYIDYPFQKNIHQLEKNEFIECLYDLYTKNEKKSYETFLEMLYGKFGKSITEKFLKPYNEKLYACDLNKLDSDAMGRFFPYANIDEIIKNMKEQNSSSYNNEFLYPKKGAEIFVQALLNDIDSEKIIYNEEVMEIDVTKKVVYLEGKEIYYDVLINTMPLNNFLKKINIDINNSKIDKKLSYNKVLVLNLGFNKKSDIKDLHWAYVPDKDINFYRFGFYDNILDSNKLSMYIEIGYNSNEKIDIEKQLDLTLKNLKKLNIIGDHELECYASIIMEPAYVHISKEGIEFKKKYKKILEEHDIYTIGRYGDWKYCSIEDNILESKELAEKLNININKGDM